MTSKAAVPVTPPDVAAFLIRSRVPRARAVARLADVLARAASGVPPLNEIREIWVFGSFARGALAVGDVDLHMRVDAVGPPERFMLDVFYGRRPFAAHIKASGVVARLG